MLNSSSPVTTPEKMKDGAMEYLNSARDRITAAEHLVDSLASVVAHARRKLQGELQKSWDQVQGTQLGILHDENLSEAAQQECAESNLWAIQSSLNRALHKRQESGIADLPTQVLVSIANLAPLTTRISLAKSCRRIQTALYSEPSLWNRLGMYDMSVSHDRSMWLRMRQILRRAARATSRHLSVTMYPDTNSTSIQWSVIGEFLQSGTTLSLTAAEPPPYWSGRYDGQPVRHELLFRNLLCDPSAALHLERLSLALGTSQQEHIWTLPPDFLCGNLGRLKSCRLEQVLLMPGFPYPAFANLREFSLFGKGFSDVYDLNLVRNLIHSAPNLVTLGLSQVGFSPDVSTNSLPQAPNLRSVYTDHILCGTAELARLFKTVPVVMYLNNVAEEAGDIFGVWPMVDLAFVMRRGQDHFQGLPRRENAEFISEVETRGQSFEFSIWSSGGWMPTGAHGRRVTSLSIHERQWESMLNVLPHLPCLTVLSVVLSICTPERQGLGVDSGIFWSDMISEQSFNTVGSQARFMSLKELNIYAGDSSWLPIEMRHGAYGYRTQTPCACETGTTIALCDVADFIRRMPLAPGTRLKRVNLHGMNDIVDVEPGKALCDLLTIVEEVEGTSEAMPVIMRSNEASHFDDVLGESSDRVLYHDRYLSPSSLPRWMVPSAGMFWDMY